MSKTPNTSNTKPSFSNGNTSGGKPGTATAPAAAKPNASISEVKPSQEQIRRRAFEIYKERTASGKRGDSTSDWVQAERELAGR